MSNGRAGDGSPATPPKKNAKQPARRAGRNGNPPPATGRGRKGRSGRKPLVFKQECERLRDAEVLPKIAAMLAERTPDDKAWIWAAEYVTKYVTSQPPIRTEVTGEDGAPVRFTLAIGEARAGD